MVRSSRVDARSSLMAIGAALSTTDAVATTGSGSMGRIVGGLWIGLAGGDMDGAADGEVDGAGCGVDGTGCVDAVVARWLVPLCPVLRSAQPVTVSVVTNVVKNRA